MMTMMMSYSAESKFLTTHHCHGGVEWYCSGFPVPCSGSRLGASQLKILTHDYWLEPPLFISWQPEAMLAI